MLINYRICGRYKSPQSLTVFKNDMLHIDDDHNVHIEHRQKRVVKEYENNLSTPLSQSASQHSKSQAWLTLSSSPDAQNEETLYITAEHLTKQFPGKE